MDRSVPNTDEILQGYLLILPEDGWTPNLQNVKCKIRKTYPDVRVSEFAPTEQDDEIESKYAKYNELMIKADVNFGEVQRNNIRKKNIIQRFCNENVMSGIGESWLSLNVFHIERLVHVNKPLLNSFALGTVVYLNTFVEHFSSAWSASDLASRITNPTIWFKHDIRKLQITFNVTDKQAKIKSVKSHFLHLLDLDYNMILRILVEVQKQPKTRKEDDIVYLRLYLFMQGAPLIKVREVHDDEDLDLDKEIENEEEDYDDDEKSVSESDSEFATNIECSSLKSNIKPQINDESPQTFNKSFQQKPNSNEKQYDHKQGHEKMNGSNSGEGRNQYSQCSKNPGKPYHQKASYNGKHFEEKQGYDRWKDSKSFKGNNGESEKYISPSFVSDRMYFRRAFEFGKQGTTSYCASRVFGMSRVLRLDLQGRKGELDEVWETATQLICCCPEAQVFFTSMKQHELKKEFNSPNISNNFNCLYALKTVLSPSFTVTDEINLKVSLKEVDRTLKEYANQCPEALEKSLFEIQAKHEKGDSVSFMKALKSLFEQNKKYSEKTESRKSLPTNMVLLRRTLITPTRIVFLPPIAHMKSYLLRTTDPEFALRVTIRDDNCDQMTFTVTGNKKSKTAFLTSVIGPKLLNGIKIGKRMYTFFGSSTSQLREHGCLFYAKDNEGNTADSIRKGLGDLHSIKNVAKFMARMGQSLSQALYNVPLSQEYVVGPVKDIEVCGELYPDSPHIGLEFSDGIGQMSPEVAEMCYKAMKLEEYDYKPSALQIRYAGCKGVILLNPNLTGKVLLLRKSMWKFDSDNFSLEILKGSYPQVAYLNRPFITILEQMGIPKDTFLKLQNKQLRNIFKSLYSSEEAVELLHQESVLRLPFRTLHRCGVDLAFDPFFRPMIMALHTSSIGVLKHKARIRLPFDKARTMLGVMDETAKLEYGQVFVQYTTDFVDGKPGRKSEVLKGTILITKNPCMHPGDVRKFTAIDVKELRHIKDCVVFPQKGPRPHPDEMAGSDLDGDEYCIIWHESLIFGKENYEAMDYTNDAKQTEKEEIDVKDMVEFMCDYIRDDCVGLIASAHLAWADTVGIFDSLCINLAKKYSITLDFAKSGKPAKLSNKERVVQYPDFMEKFREKDSYLSTKALGFLFRNCKKIEMVANIFSSEVPVNIAPCFNCEGWEEYERDAEKALLEYINLFSTPTRLFHLTNEGEIMSGAIKKLEKTFQGKNIEKNVAKMLETVIPHVMKKMKEEFYRPFLKDDIARKITRGCTSQENAMIMLQNHMFQAFKLVSNKMPIEETPLLLAMLRKASAWYNVAYKSKAEGSSLYLGLPWVVPEFLGILCARNRIEQKLPLKLKIKSFLENNEDEVKAFLREEPSKYSVELSKQIMKKIATHLGNYINLYGAEMKCLHDIMLKEIQPIIDSVDVINVKTEELIHKYLITFIDNYTDDEKEKELKKELGIIAIITLASLCGTGKLWERDSASVSDSPHFLGLAYLTKEYREEIRFPLDMGKKRYGERSKFGEIMLRYTSDISDLMQRYSRLSLPPEIDFKEPKSGNIWYVLVSVYGRPFCIETLKDLIVQPGFDEKVKKGIRDDCCIM